MLTEQQRLTEQQPSLGELLLPARRRFLRDAGLGFGGLALAALLGRDAAGNTTAGAAASTLPEHFRRRSG